MNQLSFIMLQAAAYGYSTTTALLIFFFVFAVFAIIFLIIRSILLWYWKVDVIVRNQESQTILLQHQNELKSQQTQVLKELTKQFRAKPDRPGNESLIL